MKAKLKDKREAKKRAKAMKLANKEKQKRMKVAINDMLSKGIQQNIIASMIQMGNNTANPINSPLNIINPQHDNSL